jgi:energy-coupling factor transporter ATP-binding protein EcfA2
MNQPTMNPGQALVLAGPRGCGKSTMAREIAQRAGTYAVTDGEDLDSNFRLARAMRSQPATVIVEGLPQSDTAMRWFKQAITEGTFELNEKMREPRVVRTPNFIFCTGSVDALGLDQDDRRFHIVELEAHGGK